jgi:hypothetical protein
MTTLKKGALAATAGLGIGAAIVLPGGSGDTKDTTRSASETGRALELPSAELGGSGIFELGGRSVRVTMPESTDDSSGKLLQRNTTQNERRGMWYYTLRIDRSATKHVYPGEGPRKSWEEVVVLKGKKRAEQKKPAEQKKRRSARDRSQERTETRAPVAPVIAPSVAAPERTTILQVRLPAPIAPRVADRADASEPRADRDEDRTQEKKKRRAPAAPPAVEDETPAPAAEAPPAEAAPPPTAEVAPPPAAPPVEAPPAQPAPPAEATPPVEAPPAEAPAVAEAAPPVAPPVEPPSVAEAAPPAAPPPAEAAPPPPPPVEAPPPPPVEAPPPPPVEAAPPPPPAEEPVVPGDTNDVVDQPDVAFDPSLLEDPPGTPDED